MSNFRGSLQDGGLFTARLPPAELCTGNGHDGDNQHNNGCFSHLCPRRCVTADKKPCQKYHRRYKNNDRKEDSYSHAITCFGSLYAVECTGLIHRDKACFAFSLFILIHRNVSRA